jgi:site-specific recombinase XerD
VESFNRKLLAENKSPRTIQTYGGALRLSEEFLAARGMPLTVAEIRRVRVETFITDLLARCKPATASNRYRTLNLFGWCVEEGEIRRSPMERMRPPIVPVIPPEVLSDDELRRIFKACEGRLYRDRRDMAIIRLLADTGTRVGELAGIKIAALNLEYSVIVVLGKNRRPRLCPFGRKPSLAIDCYLRLRALRENAHLEALWRPQGTTVALSRLTEPT